MICIICFLNYAFSICIFCCCAFVCIISLFISTSSFFMICVIPLDFSVDCLINFICVMTSAEVRISLCNCCKFLFPSVILLLIHYRCFPSPFVFPLHFHFFLLVILLSSIFFLFLLLFSVFFSYWNCKSTFRLLMLVLHRHVLLFCWVFLWNLFFCGVFTLEVKPSLASIHIVYIPFLISHIGHMSHDILCFADIYILYLCFWLLVLSLGFSHSFWLSFWL